MATRCVRLEGAEYETLGRNARKDERKTNKTGRHTYLCHAPPTELTTQTAAALTQSKAPEPSQLDLNSSESTQSTGEIARSDR
jgi:hypothetical protein